MKARQEDSSIETTQILGARRSHALFSECFSRHMHEDAIRSASATSGAIINALRRRTEHDPTRVLTAYRLPYSIIIISSHAKRKKGQIDRSEKYMAAQKYRKAELVF